MECCANENKVISRFVSRLTCAALLIVVGAQAEAFARDAEYTGKEISVYVTPGEPTQVNFPGKIEGGFKRKHSSVALQRQNNFLVVFAQPELAYEGEGLLVHLDDKRSYALRIMQSDDEHPRDDFVDMKDMREDQFGLEGGGAPQPQLQPRGFPPATVAPGFMRELVLVGEFGKRGGIPGYRRSNRFTGETILHDGGVEAKIEEMFLGSDMWGYVIEVSNLLDTTQHLNPASFRLDGTIAVAAEHWDLAPRPQTAEQELAKSNRGKVYIITRSLRR